MSHIPEDQPDRAVLEANVGGLLAAALVTSSITVGEISDGEARLDWYMEIRSRATRTVVERRRQRVLLRFSGTRLAAIEPIELFRPLLQ
jgi:hypothetical protein